MTTAATPVTAVSETAKDYSKFLQFNDLHGQQVQSIESSIENMLLRLDEFGALFEAVSSESSKLQHINNNILPAQVAQLEEIFKLIDRLEQWVSTVKRCVGQMEEAVSSAERAADTSAMKKTLSLLGGVRDSTPVAPPPVFSTAEMVRSFQNAPSII